MLAYTIYYTPQLNISDSTLYIQLVLHTTVLFKPQVPGDALSVEETLYVRRPKRSTQEQQIWAKIYEFIESKYQEKTGTSNTNVIDNYTSEWGRFDLRLALLGKPTA